MKVIGSILREARRRAGLSTQELADKSKISQKQITRLEGAEHHGGVRERTVKQLADVLRISAKVLDGSDPLPPPVPQPGKVAVSNVISHSSRLAIDLLSRRYGVSASEVINLAPLMFVLLAEGSLAWRRKKLEEVEAAADRLADLAKTSHLAFAHAAYRVSDAANGERSSIQEADLFGGHLDDDAYHFGYDPRTGSPFAHYLAALAADYDSSVISVDEVGGEEDGKYPSYSVCDEDLAKIAIGSKWGQLALRFGHARLDEIPKDLWSDDREKDRAKWLDDKMPAALAEAWDAIRGISL
ncbi:helix-turn-helix domain-containing protein [Devosia sp. A449]